VLSNKALAEYLAVPVTTIRDGRTDRKGPCAIKAGVRFAVSDVLAGRPSSVCPMLDEVSRAGGMPMRRPRT
jgi:hypothetical protein